jgi:hypothetical protein
MIHFLLLENTLTMLEYSFLHVKIFSPNLWCIDNLSSRLINQLTSINTTHPKKEKRKRKAEAPKCN